MKVGDLYLTKTRIALLLAVAAGKVDRSSNGLSWRGHRVVTAAVAELARAGLINLKAIEGAAGFTLWQLTDAGRDALAALDREAAR